MEEKNFVYIASYPRSGNTFARVAIEAMYGLPTLSPYKNEGDICGCTGARPKGLPVYAWKSHTKNDAYHLNRKAIYIVRDGRDALVSHAHFHKASRNDERLFEDILQRLITGKLPSYDVCEYWFNWAKHVRAWLTRPAPTALIRFEELIENPRELLAMAFEHLGFYLKDTGNPIPAFDELHAKDSTLFRRGSVGSYRDEMPDALQHLFWKYQGEGMVMAGYEQTQEAVAV